MKKQYEVTFCYQNGSSMVLTESTAKELFAIDGEWISTVKVQPLPFYMKKHDVRKHNASFVNVIGAMAAQNEHYMSDFYKSEGQI